MTVCNVLLLELQPAQIPAGGDQLLTCVHHVAHCLQVYTAATSQNPIKQRQALAVCTNTDSTCVGKAEHIPVWGKRSPLSLVNVLHVPAPLPGETLVSQALQYLQIQPVSIQLWQLVYRLSTSVP